MKRHVAKMAKTDQRCVVLLMQIPGREDHALVLPTDNLNPRYEQPVMQLLESQEGQNAESFYNVLERRFMPDNGQTVLRTLHEAGLLNAVPVSNVIMMPRPNMPFPLADILQQQGKTIPGMLKSDQQSVMEKYNSHATNQVADATRESAAISNNLLIEASMLEEEAKRKREQAYRVNPSLRPAPVAPVATVPYQSVSPELPPSV